MKQGNLSRLRGIAKSSELNAVEDTAPMPVIWPQDLDKVG